jgi:DNA-binding CsgD family transcriptional regulator
MLERAGEVAAIAALLENARGGTGGCVVLEGSAGIGKSRLLAEARGAAAASGMTVAQARCSELESDFAFGGALQLFEPLIGAADGSELLAGAAALAHPLFEDAREIDDRDFSRLHGLHWLAANLAERHPLLIALDDAHWCDVPTLRFLLYLAQRVDELPVAVVAAARTGEEGPQRKLVRRLASHSLTQRLPLDPLTPDAVAQMVRTELDPAATDAFCEACAGATGGNPLFVRALLVGVRERGGAVDDAAAERVPELGAEALAQAVTARLDAMADGCRELAESVAVLGDGAPLAQAAVLAGLDEPVAEARLDALVASGILEHAEGVGFAHPILRAAVDSGMDASLRATAHRRAARLLREAGADAERVASHVMASGEGARDAQAAELLREAARRASARGAPHAAARYLGAVIGSDGQADAALLRELALAEVRSHHRDAPARVAAALAAAADARDRGAAALRLGLAQFDAGAHDPAAATFAAGLDGLPEDLEVARTLRACLSAASGLGHAGGPAADLDPVVERAELNLATRPERLHLGHAAMAAAFAGKSIDDTLRFARAALMGDPLDAGRASEMSALILATVALVVADDLDGAESALDETLASARRIGSVTGYASAAHIRAWVYYRSGRLAEAIADGESVVDAARYGWEPALPAAQAVMALCHLERADPKAAAAALDLPGGEERWSATFTFNDWLDARGHVRMAEGDTAAALEDFRAAGRALDGVGASHPSVVAWRSGAVAASAALGDLEAARELAAEDIERAREFGAPRALGLALRAAGRLAGGDRGIALLREACEVLASSPARLEHAHAQADLGVELLAAGHRVAAREPLKGALDTAHECGATALAERARADLTEAGARPRRPALRGRDSLTPRELRLAEMAASGLTNREIAEALFITTKTVETHLRHAYDKLGISSRRELSDALAST